MPVEKPHRQTKKVISGLAVKALDYSMRGCELELASSPDLPASFGTRSEAEGLVPQVT